MKPRTLFGRGAFDSLPIVVGATPFGLVTGMACASLGFDAVQSTLISGLIFAGASQLAAYGMLTAGAPGVVVAVTAILINLRFLLYSAAAAPWFRGRPWPVRLVAAFMLSDQAYALTAAHSLREPNAEDRVSYYLGSAVTMWTMWVLMTFAGATVGVRVPAAWALDFAVPLCFIALVVPAIQDRTQLIVAAVTATVAWVTQSAPAASGTVIAIVLGVAVGAALSREKS